jgi:hypothetical protein
VDGHRVSVDSLFSVQGIESVKESVGLSLDSPVPPAGQEHGENIPPGWLGARPQ